MLGLILLFLFPIFVEQPSYSFIKSVDLFSTFIFFWSISFMELKSCVVYRNSGSYAFRF